MLSLGILVSKTGALENQYAILSKQNGSINYSVVELRHKLPFVGCARVLLEYRKWKQTTPCEIRWKLPESFERPMWRRSKPQHTRSLVPNSLDSFPVPNPGSC